MTVKIGVIKYIDENGIVKVLNKPYKKKKYESKFPLVYTDFGVFITLQVFLSLGIGHFADLVFQRKPLFTLIGIVIGGLLAIINLYLLLKKDDGSSRSTR